MEKPEILSEEKSVRKVGRTVQRPARHWSPNVKLFLEYLEAAGLPVEHMSRLDQTAETYDFVQGEMVHPYRWKERALYEMGGLTAALHRTARDFVPNEKFGYQKWCLREIGGNARIWCHGDIAPWNIITKDGMPHRIVDWEYSGPLDPMVELARICWLFPQLVDDDLGQLYSLPSPRERALQVRLICDGYGLEKRRREQLIKQMIEVIICETAHEAIDTEVTFEDAGCLWGFAWRTRSLYWVWRNRKALEAALR